MANDANPTGARFVSAGLRQGELVYATFSSPDMELTLNPGTSAGRLYGSSEPVAGARAWIFLRYRSTSSRRRTRRASAP